MFHVEPALDGWVVWRKSSALVASIPRLTSWRDLQTAVRGSLGPDDRDERAFDVAAAVLFKARKPRR
jgi:hypothetical protein